MFVFQKYRFNLILLSIFIVFISNLSGTNLKGETSTIFKDASVRIDDNQRAPLEVKFQEGQNVSVAVFFEAYKEAFDWSDNNEAILFRELEDNMGQTHHRFKQYYKGIELAEVQYLLHERDGFITYAHGKLIHNLNIDVTPVISESEALSRALDHINADSYMWENKKNEAFIIKELRDRKGTFYPDGDLKISAGLKEHVVENFRLVYRFDVFAEKPMSRNYIDVDAKTGEIIGVIPRLYSDDIEGSGRSLYNGDVSIVVADTNFYSPDDPPAHFHVDDWNAYSSTSWWIADTTIGNNGGYSDNWYDVLDTDPIEISGEQVSLSFRHRYAVEFPEQFENFDGWDGMNVRISLDDGQTWQVLTNPTPIYSNESLYSFGSTHGEGEGIPGWTGVLNSWTDVSFNLSAFSGSTVRIRFAFAADEGVSTEFGGDADWFGWQIDDIIIANMGDTLFINDGNEEGMTATNFVREAVIVDGNYRLRESGRGGGITTLDMRESWVHWQAVDFVDSDSNFTDSEDQVGVSTHWAVEATYDYFLNKHNRNSFDNAGSRIISFSNYGEDFLNAQWMGSFMRFGGGNASNNFRSLVGIDVVGHEFSHGVTQFTAGLIYQDQYGALNESFSDIFGEHIEYVRLDGNNDWLMGAESGAIRSFSNPNTLGQPDTYLGSLWYTGTGDYGGVHVNSGVQNFWFYLLSEGGTGVNDNGDTYSVTAIGIEDAAKIAYHNLNYYLMPRSEYEDSRRGSLNAAIDLFGLSSQQFASVLDAWNAVGVYFPFMGPYAESANVNNSFFKAGIDTLIVTANIINPKNHHLEVNSIIGSLDQSIIDTIAMFDDGMHQDSVNGDGIWGESWPIPSGERHYLLHTTTASLDSGFKNILYNAAHFTTVGPVKFESQFDEELRLGVFSQRFLFKIKLHNMGQVTPAEGIGAMVRLLSPDSCFTMTESYREYGNINPGEIVDGLQYYSMTIDTTCLQSGSVVIPFVVDITSNGYVFWTDTFSVDILATDISDINLSSPKIYTLSPNWPNPFNPKTSINYELPTTNVVDLSIYNLVGQKVATLVSKKQNAGLHQVEWDASGFASGVYYYKMKSGDFQAVRKMILLR